MEKKEGKRRKKEEGEGKEEGGGGEEEKKERERKRGREETCFSLGSRTAGSGCSDTEVFCVQFSWVWVSDLLPFSPGVVLPQESLRVFVRKSIGGHRQGGPRRALASDNL